MKPDDAPSASPKRKPRRILMLATDAHGAFGGIAQYNRDVLEAMSHDPTLDEIVVLPRVVSSKDFEAPAKVRYDLKGAGSQAAFVIRGIYQAILGGPFSLVYCAHLNLLPLAMAISKLRRVPLVLAIYGIDAWRQPKSRLAAECARNCDHVVSISQITLDRFQEWAGRNADSYALLPNAIKADLYGKGPKNDELVERFKLEGRQVIMTFGRISADERYKGFDEVLDVLPSLRTKIPDITYLICGDGSDRERLIRKADANGVADLVVFAGRIPEDRKADFYRLADAYVMPSSGEGFGFVVLEALACGLPVVASQADGTREAVKGGELGSLVDPRDSVALEEAITKALKQEKIIPPGLEYFSFPNFQSRMHTALASVLAY